MGAPAACEAPWAWRVWAAAVWNRAWRPRPQALQVRRWPSAPTPGLRVRLAQAQRPATQATVRSQVARAWVPQHRKPSASILPPRLHLAVARVRQPATQVVLLVWALVRAQPARAG